MSAHQNNNAWKYNNNAWRYKIVLQEEWQTIIALFCHTLPGVQQNQVNYCVHPTLAFRVRPQFECLTSHVGQVNNCIPCVCGQKNMAVQNATRTGILDYSPTGALDYSRLYEVFRSCLSSRLLSISTLLACKLYSVLVCSDVEWSVVVSHVDCALRSRGGNRGIRCRSSARFRESRFARNNLYWSWILSVATLTGFHLCNK
jgi:hypothetical protein